MRTLTLLFILLLASGSQSQDVNSTLNEYVFSKDVFLNTFDRDYGILSRLDEVDTLIVYDDYDIVAGHARYVFFYKDLVDGYDKYGCGDEYIRLRKRSYEKTARRIEDIKKGNLIWDSIGSKKILTFISEDKFYRGLFENGPLFYVLYIKNKKVDSICIIHERLSRW